MKLIKAYLLITILSTNAIWCQTKHAEIVFMEHALRWGYEYNFPHFSGLPEVQAAIFDTVAEHLKRKFDFETVILPQRMNYRMITGFNNPKVNWPKNANPERYEVAVLSAISRAGGNLNMFWALQVSVRKGSEVLYDQTVKRQLKPHSQSYYINHQRWFEQQQFIDIFTRLLDEGLGLREPLTEDLPLKTFETSLEKVREIIPNHKRLMMAVADTIIEKKRHRAYQLREGEQVLNTWIYREDDYVAGVYKESFTGAFIGTILNSLASKKIAPVPMSGKYYVMLNTLESSFGGKWIIRNSKDEDGATTTGKKRSQTLDEQGSSGRGGIDRGSAGNTNQMSTVSGLELMNSRLPGQVLAAYVYVKALNTNFQQLDKSNFKLAGTTTYGTLGVTDTHILRGEVEGEGIEIIYPEQSGLLLIKRDGNPVAMMPMANQNPESNYFFNLMTYYKNKTVVMADPETGIGSPREQQYYLYVDENTDGSQLMDEMRQLILMLHTIDWDALVPRVV